MSSSKSAHTKGNIIPYAIMGPLCDIFEKAKNLVKMMEYGLLELKIHKMVTCYLVNTEFTSLLQQHFSAYETHKYMLLIIKIPTDATIA